jgi:hypothetical protein
MYNVPSYRRLFPPEYLRNAEPVEPELQFMSLWGQFLDHTWQVRADRADLFLQKVDAASSLKELTQSFPLPVIATHGTIAPFYLRYGIE